MSFAKNLASVDSIATKYKLHSFRDIYVEGISDLIFMKKCLSRLSLDSVKVYDVSMYDFESEKIWEHPGYEGSSNRDKVRYLLKKKGECSTPFKGDYIGFIDRDYHGWKPESHPNDILMTDFSCMEAYFWNVEGVIGYLKSLVPSGADIDFLGCSNMIRTVFFIRFVNNQREKYSFIDNKGKPIDWWDYSKIVKSSGSSVYEFDLDKFVLSSRWSMNREERESFAKAVLELLGRLKLDFRFEINGHDMVDILCSHINSFSPKTKYNSDQLAKTFPHLDGCYGEIVDFPVFAKIKKWSAGPARGLSRIPLT